MPCIFYYFARMRTQRCGFMDLAPEQCPLSPETHITVSRGRTSSMLDSGKVNSLHSSSGLSVIQTFITLLLACPWSTSSKMQGTQLLAAHKASPRSSLNNYGRTITSILNHGLVFQGLVVSLKVANERHFAVLIINVSLFGLKRP